MSYLADLSMGLRQAGRVLSPTVSDQVSSIEGRQEAAQNAKWQMAAQQVIKGIETGAIDKTQGQAALEKLGFGGVEVGPSPETLARVEAVKKAQIEAARMDAFRSELAALPPDAPSSAAMSIASKYASPDHILQYGMSAVQRAPEAQKLVELLDKMPADSPYRAPIESRLKKLGQGDVPNAVTPVTILDPENPNGTIIIDGRTREVLGKGPKLSEAGKADIKIETPAPVTAVTIQDPEDPNGTIVVDGRTGRVIGKGSKMTEVGKSNFKRQIASQGVSDAIEKSRELLTGKGGEELPTGSGVGSVVDYVGSLVGATPAGAKTADKLRVVGGSLVQKVPRFEGPQSDKDVSYYKEVAGRIGDSTLPIARRLAALDEVENIWGQFEQGKKYGYITPDSGGRSASGKITQPTNPLDAALSKYPPRNK
jgi:hypothetical protein